MAVVVFNYASWIARYPEFSVLANGADPTVVAPLCFDEACIYLNNTDASLVRSVAVRTVLLNMLTAHIMQLNFGSNGQTPTAMVGRVSSATEGSVSVSTAMDTPGSAAWFEQTKYGSAYWQASAQFRMMRYVPPPLQPYDSFSRW